MTLQNYSKKIANTASAIVVKTEVKHSWLMFIVVPAWIFVCFYTAQLLIMGLVWILNALNINLSVINGSIYNAVVAALIYVITLVFSIGGAWLIFRRRTNKFDLGINRLPSWVDILLSPAGLIVYFIFSSILILLATRVLPGFDANQVQNTGFSHLSQRYEYIAAFTALVVIAPIAEELLFRGYLFGKLKKYIPVWAAILATSVLFGAAHGAWNLAVDTFALSVVLCLLRQISGTIWPSILLHMLKNGIAFYLLFINPLLLTTLLR